MKTGRLVIVADGEKWSGYDLRESWQNLLKQWVW